MKDQARLLADRLRFLWQQPKLGLKDAQEIVDSLPGIIMFLDELSRLHEQRAAPLSDTHRPETKS